MEIIKKTIKRFFRWEYSWLCLIILATLILHLMSIAIPAEPLFDEAHYVPDARTIINSHYTNRGEHPPLAKLMMVTGIYIFGDNPWGWRMPSVFFGTMGIVFFYLMCRSFNLSRRTAVLGTFILAMENLYFVHAGIAMLDIFTVSFSLLAYWLYARRSYPLSGVAVALATLAKYTGVFTVFAIIIHWLLGRGDKKVVFGASLAIAGISFFLLLAAFDAAIYLRMTDFISELWNGLNATASLTFVTAAHVSMSRPWEWIFNLEIMPYWYGPHFIGLVSFSVWALTVPTVIYMTVKAILKDKAALFGIAMFAGTYLPWIPMSLITNRVSFIFYFLPVVPSICFGLGMGLDQLISYWQKKRVPKVARVIIPDTAAAVPAELAGNPAAPGQDITAVPSGEVMISDTTTINSPGEPALITAVPLASTTPELPARPAKWWRKGKLQWAAIAFVVLFFLVHIATFIIVAPPLNNWHIENWFS